MSGQTEPAEQKYDLPCRGSIGILILHVVYCYIVAAKSSANSSALQSIFYQQLKASLNIRRTVKL